MKKLMHSYRDVLLLTLAAILVGIAVGAVDALFGRVLITVTALREEKAFWLIPFLPLAGAGIVACYLRFGGESVKGMTLVFEAGHGISEEIPLRMIPFSMVGTWLTHLFGGSAGREGVAIQIGATVSHGVGRRLPIPCAGRILLVAGMAAGFSGLFQTPLAAVFFAMEVLTVGVVEHRAALPALAASYAACTTSHFLGLEKFTMPLADPVSLSPALAGRLVVLGVLFGITGGLFSVVLHALKKRFAVRIGNPVRRIVLIGIAVSAFSLLCWGGRYSGLGTNLISMSFRSGIFGWDFALKFLFTVITLAAGYQGGEVTPLFSIGASLGVALSGVLGLPPAFAAALGYAGVFGSATNTLLAPMLIGAEVFGYEYLPFFLITSLIAYVCNGNRSIYALQRERKDD